MGRTIYLYVNADANGQVVKRVRESKAGKRNKHIVTLCALVSDGIFSARYA
jgi:hypothetical protein